MAYIWGRPNLSPAAQNQAGVVGSFASPNVATPPQFAAERPCPLYAGCSAANYYQWLDPVYPEYRDVNFPKMGSWPPPQPGPAYDDWVSQQRQWMPYEICCYNGVVPSDACADTRGRPNPENRGQSIHFDFASDPSWPFVTAWTGVRFVCEITKHGYVTNEGNCGTGGPVGVGMWVKKAPNPYPAPPAWADPTTLIQSLELDSFGIGNYSNPYGFNVLTASYETTTHPGGGAWVIADVDRYWFALTQTVPSAFGNATGTNNGTLGFRKTWAAAIVTLGGAPAANVGATATMAVVG